MIKRIALFIFSIALISCANMGNSGMGETKTFSTNSIFLEPSPRKTIIVQAGSSENDLYLKQSLEQGLRYKGYTIVQNPNNAEYVLNANIVSIVMKQQNEHGVWETIGGAIVGGVVGSAFGSGGGQVAASAAGAIVGGYAGHELSKNNQEMVYEAIVNVQIKQKTSTNNQGFYSNYKTYNTQVVSRVNRANLSQTEAFRILSNNVTASILRFF